MLKNKSSLVVLCGIDASGKTTLLDRLKREKTTFKIIQWKDLSKLQNTYVKLPVLEPARYVETLQPLSRAIFFSSITLEMLDRLIQPCLDAGESVIVDSYIYKWWAKEKIINISDPILYKVFSSLPSPDQVVFIDTDPRITVARKTMSSYEKRGNSLQETIEFQTTIRNEILSLVSAFNLQVIDGGRSQDEIYSDLKIILDQCSDN